MTVADATRLFKTNPATDINYAYGERELEALQDGWAKLSASQQRQQRSRLAPWAKEIIAQKLIAFSKVTRGPEAERFGSIVAAVSDNEGYMPSFVDFATPKL